METLVKNIFDNTLYLNLQDKSLETIKLLLDLVFNQCNNKSLNQKRKTQILLNNSNNNNNN